MTCLSQTGTMPSFEFGVHVCCKRVVLDDKIPGLLAESQTQTAKLLIYLHQAIGSRSPRSKCCVLASHISMGDSFETEQRQLSNLWPPFIYPSIHRQPCIHLDPYARASLHALPRTRFQPTSALRQISNQGGTLCNHSFSSPKLAPT